MEDAKAETAGAVPPGPSAAPPDKKAELRQQALADAGVQAMLEVFPAPGTKYASWFLSAGAGSGFVVVKPETGW